MSRNRMYSARIPRTRAASRFFHLLLCVGLLTSWSVVPAIADDKKESKPKPHSDEQVEEAFKRFDNEYKSEDIGKRLRMLRWIGAYQHKRVLKRLKKILFSERDLELQAVAAQGLGNQYPYAKDATKVLMKALDKYSKYGSRMEPMPVERQAINNEESAVLVNAVHGLSRLHPHTGKRHKNDGFKELKKLADHTSDDVAVAVFQYFGTTKEFRSLPLILEWFNAYPDGYSWSGASAAVDTGAEGSKDQNAAKAKALGKAGKKKKVRPAAFAAMAETIKQLTGIEMKKPAELKAWMKANKLMLKKAGM